MTSWFSVFSSSLALSTKAFGSAKQRAAPARIRAKSACGTTPSLTRASPANNSISSQIFSLFSSVQITHEGPTHPARLPFVHLGAGGLEDLAFPLGEAMDPAGGNLFEDGIDFF